MTLEELKKAVSEQIIVKRAMPFSNNVLTLREIDMLEWFKKMLNEVETK